MLQRLLARWRPWAEALAGIDDPQGEFLLGLEERVRRLEDVVVNLRTPLPADAAVEVTSAPGVGRKLPPSNLRGIK